ncbi:MAG: HipA domain-containing protein [Acetobacteraceae bacterium]|nr:HipA domain-containing protein [Acetobacteraceae bacterium]
MRRLDVRLDGQDAPVGTLEGLAGPGGYPIRFAYAPDYVGPPLSAALRPRAAPYGNREARVFFDNLLPEGPQRLGVVPPGGGRPVAEDDVAALLEVLGAECPGAVSVLPVGAPPAKAAGDLDADYEHLGRAEIGALLAAAARGESPDRTLRFSLAGVQRKLALAVDPRDGAFLRPRRPGVPTTHLLKVEAAGDATLRGIVRNEALCLCLAAALGLPAARARSDAIGGVPVLLVERFDRAVEGRTVRRLHQEDAAQALGLDRSEKYEDEARRRGRDAGFEALAGAFAALTASPAETRDVLRRAAFLNWLLGNTDAHMKNFALLHPGGGGRPALAPLYDLVSVLALTDRYPHMAMAIAGAVDGDEVGRGGIEWLAELGGPPRIARAALRRRLEAFRTTAASALPTIDRLVEAGEFGRTEVKSVRDVVASRLRLANAAMGWDIPAKGDAPIRSGGGWASSPS